LGLGRQGMLKRQGTDLLGQVDGMAARRRTESTATTTELRCLAIAMTSAARTLLLHELLARACAFRPVLHVMRAGHGLELLVTNHAVQDVWTNFETEDVVLEIDRTGGLTLECGYLEFHLLRFSRGSG